MNSDVLENNEVTGLVPQAKRYAIRNLRYTLAQLLIVSALMVMATQALTLLCYQLVPSVKPILLDRSGASATQIALIIGTLPQAVNFVLCPLISTLSDKTRTRFGRRTPYLIISAPVLVILLMMIGWTKEIAAYLTHLIPVLQNINMPLWTLATLILLFQVAYLFPGSVVCYLIADVIPKECIGRYMAVSTILGTVMGAFFSFFILDYAVNFMKPTFCIIGALYMIAYLLQFFFVKEGEYPPVQDNVSGDGFVRKTMQYLVLFFRQCFQHKIFVFLFLSTGLNQASNICRSMYNVLFATKEIGMTIGYYGKIMGIGALISAVLILFMGKIMDKYHPMMVYLIGGIFIMGVNVFGYFFVHTPLTFAVIGVATSIMYAIQGLANTPLLINLLPMDKYGQFASANSMVNSVAVFFGAWLGGYLTDCFGYRVMFVWDFCVTLLATFALLIVYKEWHRLGGKQNYVPPKIP